ncbi:MAG: ABC transporter substrate-binding protein [Desulfurococcales archaeon]|nr:ABC transporter substrate-binding protein [Desulfurococcales archaeon]
MKGKIAILIVALMILPMAASIASAAYVNTITIQRVEDDQQAIQSLQNGLSQARLFRIRDINLVQNMTQQGFQAIKAASGLVNLLVNPADTCADGSVNLFSNRKARFALQFLVDRQQIVSNIYKGYAIPVVGPWTPLDPDYPYLIGTLVKWQVIIASKGHDYGVQLMEEALNELGATKGADGKWYIGDQPVTVKFVIRTEDARKDIGDQIANTLESLGITVERLYKDFSGAFQIVYTGDPAACEWHLYTEGWGITGMTKYDYGNFVWFYSSIWGAMPGWGVEGYWNYENKTIDEIAKKLDSGNYTSEDEFWQLVNQGLELGIKESVRVFIAATYDFYLASPDLQGIIPSPKASPWHTFTFMNLQYPEDSVTFTNRYVYAPGWKWNPVGGWQDFYSRPVVEAITFPAITSRITDGETGWSPANVATYKVVKNVSLPGDAIYYDTEEHTFKTISEGNVTVNGTINEVIINYKLLGKLKFHDGSTETVADLLAPLYIAFEYGTDTSTNETKDTRYESAVASDYSTLLATFVGVEIVNDTTVKIYTTYNHIDDGYIAQVASIWTSFPLELYAAMDLLWQYGSETQGGNVTYYVFSLDSEDENHTAIHLLDKTACDQMKDLLLNAKNNPPDWVQQLINLGVLTMEEWQTRVDNLVNFYDQHGHMVVGNGPFYLDSYDAANDIAVLKRVQDFPVPVQEIAAELQPKTANLEIDVPTIVGNTAGSIVANITVTVNGQPANESNVKLYVVLLDLQTFQTIFADLQYLGNGEFVAKLPSDIATGDYKLIAIAYPVGYSNPAMAVQSITVAPLPVGGNTTTGTQTTQTTTTGGATSPGATTPGGTTTTTETTSKTGMIAAAVIVVIIIAAAAYYFAKK